MTKFVRPALQGPIGIALLGAVPAIPGAFVLAGILQGSGTKGFLHDMVQPHYFAAPEPIALHIASGTLFCVLAPLQFSVRLRMRFRKLHRIAGRVAMIAGLLFALTAIWLMGLPPAKPELWLHYTAMNAGGIGVSVSLGLSFMAIRRGEVSSHQQWMRRAIAFGLLGASRILFDLILIPIVGYETPTSEGISVWLALALTLFVAERLSKSGRSGA